jgi:hypothetical protein
LSEVVLDPIPVGTTFYVPLGGVHVMGLVHASATFPSAAGVVYVQMIGPPLRREGWQPEYETWWIVDDLALRDGSWPFQAPIAEFAAEPMRRFAGMNGDRRVLVTVAPDTLTLAGTAAVDTPETRAEWETAPRLSSPIVSVFEDSLARTMELPPPQRAHDDAENASRFVIANTRLREENVVDPLTFEFSILFSDERNASRARDAARADGTQAELDRADDGERWELTIAAEIVPTYPLVAPHIERWNAFAQQFDGGFDGFGAWARGWNTERARSETAE